MLKQISIAAFDHPFTDIDSPGFLPLCFPGLSKLCEILRNFSETVEVCVYLNERCDALRRVLVISIANPLPIYNGVILYDG